MSDTTKPMIQRNGSTPTQTGPASAFTGDVRIDALHQAPAPSRVSTAHVSFAPGARTHWHTHPLGQTLIVTSGVGWTQCGGGAIEEIRPGDTIWCPCQRRHWHGATTTSPMSHIAVTESLDGKAVEWMEPVSDEQYLAGRAK